MTSGQQQSEKSRAAGAKEVVFTAFLVGLCCLIFSKDLPAQVRFVELLGHRPYQSASDVWGYTDDEGIDYAIMGIYGGTVIIDATTDPARLTEVAFIPGPPSGWRDIKTHLHYAYVTTEGAGPGGGMQIIDLSDPSEATLVATYNSTFTTAHNLYVAEGYAYVVGTDTRNGGIHILDLANPTAPVEVGVWGVTYVHDVYVRNDTAYAAALYEGGLAILDVSDKTRPREIVTISYPDAVTHNAWTTEDGNYVLTTDETFGGHMKIWDIRDLRNIQLVGFYQTDPEISIHNVLVKGDFAYIAYYKDWLRIVDISDPSNPTEVGVFDLNLDNSGGLYSNAWGVFPFTSNGQIYLSHMEEGLYVFVQTTEEKPYISLESFAFNDDSLGHSLGNGNSIIDPGEVIELSLSFSNIGYIAAAEATVALKTEDPHITVLDSTETSVNIETMTTIVLEDIFSFLVLPTTPKGHRVFFTIEITDRVNNHWTFNVDIIVFPQFADIAAAAGVAHSGPGNAAVWGDYDGDGWLDLYVTNEAVSNVLYRNNRDGTFADATDFAGVSHQRGGVGAAFADYDNDGDLDFYLTDAFFGPGWPSGQANVFYRNNGDGSFSDATPEAGVQSSEAGLGLAWGDFNNDGYADLYVCNLLSPNHLFQNNRNGTFTDVASEVRLAHAGQSTAAVFVDYDNDGDLDIFVASFSSPNRLFRNDGPVGGQWRFTDVTIQSGLAESDVGFDCSFGDYDNDGDLDLFITRSFLGATSLFQNNGPPDWTFTDVTDAAGVKSTGSVGGAAFGDYNNDGYLDIYLVINGQANALYHNNGPDPQGDWTFSDIAYELNVDYDGVGSDAGFGDFDRDGHLDIYLVNFGEPNVLYLNTGTENNWLMIHLIGISSNGSAIGARVRAVTGLQSQMREVRGVSGVHFGLGASTLVDTLEIRWPSGKVQILTDVAANQYLQVIEPRLGHDLTVRSSPEPSAATPILANITPRAVIRNIGMDDELGVSVTCQIDTFGIVIYSDTQSVDTLKTLEVKEVAFERWATSEEKIYNLSFYTHLSNDENGANNTLRVTTEVSNLMDDFESGLGKWHSDNGWGVTEVFVHSGTFSLNDSPEGEYENSVDSPVTYNFSFDLSELEAAHISYWTMHFLEQDHDFGYVEVSIDSGLNWVQLGESYTGVSNWAEESRSLTQYCGPGFNDVRIRFRMISDSTQMFPLFGWFLDDVAIHIGQPPTGVESELGDRLPTEYALSNNYPNPFNARTVIEYQLPRTGQVKLAVYNILGQRVRVLVDAPQEAGFYKLVWDGKGERGKDVASGVYFYLLKAGDYKQVKKMLLLR